MARKAIVDKDVILRMLREGETTQRIAEKFNVSRQAIDIHRRDFIEKGLLPNKRAARTRKTAEKAAPQKQNLISPSQALPSKDNISLDEQIDLIINAFNALKRLPQLEKEVPLLEKGEHVLQETRLWDDVSKKTFTMRSKEEAHDYRYFPEPDLPLFYISQKEIEGAGKSIPELPAARMKRFMREYELTEYDAKISALEAKKRKK